MNRANLSNQFVTTPADVTKLAASIMNADTALIGGRATYLRSLLAATQAELAGKPIQRVTGRPKRPDLEGAVTAFEKANETFYAAVLAAVPEGLTPDERQSKTSFARSASATLRGALRTGWNPLGASATSITKGVLTTWVASHREPRPVSPVRVEKRVLAYVGRMAELLNSLPKEEAERILGLALQDLGQPAPQRLTNLSVRRVVPEARAH